MGHSNGWTKYSKNYIFFQYSFDRSQIYTDDSLHIINIINENINEEVEGVKFIFL